MSSITWRSRVLSGLFAFFIGHPATLKMPADFAYIPADRALPPPGTFTHERKVKRIYVDHVRRQVTQKVGVVMTVVALLFTGVFLLINGAVKGVGHLTTAHWFQHHPAGPALTTQQQAEVDAFLARADVSMCQRVSQRKKQLQNDPGATVPIGMDAVLQGCHDKFGDAVDSN